MKRQDIFSTLSGAPIFVAMQSSPNQLRNKRICLLIAHPDDEAMFFAPTVMAITRPELGNSVKILCFSSGNADGLGEIRKKELVQSGLVLGLGKAEDIAIVDRPDDFPDSMTKTWEASQISALFSAEFAPDRNHPAINVIITFDKDGVSGHPNHISLYHGAKAFLGALKSNANNEPPVRLYTLRTVSLLRKYTSIADLLPTSLTAAWGQRRGPASDMDHPTRLVFMVAGLSGAGGLSTAWRAMTEAHQSQMVWFRYGWISLSRYMVMNDLWLEDSKSG